MAIYTNLKGITERSTPVGLSPTSATVTIGPIPGEIWFDTVTCCLQTRQYYTGQAWVATPSLITARCGLAGSGVQTSALAFGGFTTVVTNANETWNGTTWATSPGSMVTARTDLAGIGITNTASVAVGGFTTAVSAATETWNGTAWATSPGSLTTARRNLGGAGQSNTAGIAFGGCTTLSVACSDTWNGTAWTVKPAMSVARSGAAGAGTNAATIAFGGCTTTAVACVETWNNTAWAAGTAFNTARCNVSGNGTTNTAAIAFGGGTPAIGGTAIGSTETWNGTAWTTIPSLSTFRYTGGGVGTSTLALSFGGYTGTGAVSSVSEKSSSVVCSAITRIISNA